MDEMKIKLSTPIMRGIVSKLLSNALFKKFGIRTVLNFNEINIEKSGGTMHIHVNVDGEIGEQDLIKMTGFLPVKRA